MYGSNSPADQKTPARYNALHRESFRTHAAHLPTGCGRKLSCNPFCRVLGILSWSFSRANPEKTSYKPSSKLIYSLCSQKRMPSWSRFPPPGNPNHTTPCAGSNVYWISNVLVRSVWSKEQGYIYRVGSARLYFFSGQPRSNIVGATASLLLEVDEAQDVLISKFDKEIAPMAASTNATRVFWGTAWTSRTLLARELRASRQAELADGIRRVFVIDANQVAAEVPAYGDFMKIQVAKLGRQHPMIKTQFFCEEIDAEGGLFPPERCALMRGRHPAALAPEEGKLYAMTVDVAGEDEGVSGDPGDDQALENPARDSTALTIAEVDLDTLSDEFIRKPTYKVIYRAEWVGVKHTQLYARLKSLAEAFDIRYLVVDATGVGAGLSSFLSAAIPSRVLPFEFNTRTKSDLCWNFLGVCDSGRFKDHVSPAGEDLLHVATAQQEFWRQVQFCEFEILPGPNKTVRWGVPDGTRDPASGELVHDDLLISAAMLSLIDKQDWSISSPNPGHSSRRSIRGYRQCWLLKSCCL